MCRDFSQQAIILRREQKCLSTTDVETLKKSQEITVKVFLNVINIKSRDEVCSSHVSMAITVSGQAMHTTPTRVIIILKQDPRRVSSLN